MFAPRLLPLLHMRPRDLCCFIVIGFLGCIRDGDTRGERRSFSGSITRISRSSRDSEERFETSEQREARNAASAFNEKLHDFRTAVNTRKLDICSLHIQFERVVTAVETKVRSLMPPRLAFRDPRIRFQVACLSGTVRFIDLAHAVGAESRAAFCDIAEGYLNIAWNESDETKVRWLFDVYEETLRNTFESEVVGWQILEESLIAYHQIYISRKTRDVIWMTLNKLLLKGTKARIPANQIAYFLETVQALIIGAGDEFIEDDSVLKLQNLQIMLMFPTDV